MINYNVDSDGIATITWDMPNRTMNVLNEASMTAYAGALDELERRNLNTALITLCIGAGMGTATIIERV